MAAVTPREKPSNGGVRLTRADVLTLAAAVAFFGYFAVLVHCDLWRPEPEGFAFRFSGPRMLVTSVAPGSAADRAGFQPGDEIRAWNGQGIDSRIDWAAVEANYEIGQPMAYEVVRAGATFGLELTLGLESPRYWLTRAGISLIVVRLVQLVTLVFGAVIAFRRRHDAAALVGAWLLAAAGVFCIVLPYRFAAVWRGLPLVPGLLLWAPYASSLVIAGLLFSFFQVFPRRTLRPAWMWGVAWIPMAAAVTPHLSHAVRMVYRPRAMTVAPDVMIAIVVVSLGYVAATVATSVRAWRRLDETTERRRMKVLVFGSTIGCVTAGPLVLAYWGTSREPALFESGLFAAGTFALLAVPLSFAYAILRHRLFDLRVIVRLGVRYALARGVLRAIVPALAIAFVIDLVAHRAESVGAILASRGWIYAVLGAGAAFAESRRQRWLDTLDRRFFRERYDAHRLLRQVVDDVRQGGTLDQVAPRAVGRIAAALHPEHVALLVKPSAGDRFGPAATHPAGPGLGCALPDGTLAALLRAVGKPIELVGGRAGWILGQLPPEERELVAARRIEMLVPVVLRPGGAESVLVLGPKRSEEPYSQEDLDLLGAVAGSLALAMERPAGPAPGGERVVEECPRCGACYDTGARQCSSDGEALRGSRLPRVLSGRYRLDRRLARGGMGTVYVATDTALERDVAVKVIRDELVGDRSALDRFQREARVAAGFTHANVVTVHDFGIAGEAHAFLVMELLHGITVRQLLAGGGRIAPARAAAILDGVARAVDAAHRRRIIHRDLKPENVMLVTDERGETPKVLDFGVAKLLDSRLVPGGAHTTGPGGFVGTPFYMAPEQLRGEEATPGWDLWALAVMAYEMLTGRHPFAEMLGARGGPGDGAHEAGGGERLPAAWRRFFDGALAGDAARRPTSGLDLIAELREAMDRAPGDA